MRIKTTSQSYDTMIIGGRNAVYEILKARLQDVKKLYLEKDAKGRKIEKIVSMAKNNIQINYLQKKELDILSKKEIHQGVMVEVLRKTERKLNDVLKDCETKGESPFIIVLSEMRHDQNLGAIMRTAVCAGVHAIVVPNQSRGVTPEVVRVSVGASEYIPLIKMRIYSAIKELKKYGMWVIGAETNAKKLYYESNFKGPIAFVIGGEDKGLTESMREKCDYVVKIPMKRDISSLNVGIATALLLYEKVRQETK